MGFTGFYWVFLSVTGFFLVLLGLTGFQLVLLGFIGFLLGFYWVLLGFTGFPLVFCNISELGCRLPSFFFFWLFFFRTSSVLVSVRGRVRLHRSVATPSDMTGQRRRDQRRPYPSPPPLPPSGTSVARRPFFFVGQKLPFLFFFFHFIFDVPVSFSFGACVGSPSFPSRNGTGGRSFHLKKNKMKKKDPRKSAGNI